MVQRIGIVGAGLAGLVLAQCLRRRQIQTVIWEKAKQFPPQQNFAITLYPHVLEPLLQALETDETSFSKACSIGRNVQHGASIRVNRPALLRTLSTGLDIKWNHKLLELKPGKTHNLTFEVDEAQSQQQCDIVIVTDGVHSATRRSLNISKDEFELQVLPFIVYNGKRRFKLDTAPDGLAACIEMVEGLSHQEGDVLLQITAGSYDEQSNELGINYTLSRPAKGASDQKLLDRSNSDAELLAKKFVEEAAQFQDLPEPFTTVFNPDILKQDRLLHWLMRSALLSAHTAEKLYHAGIVLIGDASHPVPILGGAGGNNAILDAIELAAVLSQNADLSKVTGPWSQRKQKAEQNLREMHGSSPQRSAI